MYKYKNILYFEKENFRDFKSYFGVFVLSGEWRGSSQGHDHDGPAQIKIKGKAGRPEALALLKPSKLGSSQIRGITKPNSCFFFVSNEAKFAR